MFADEARGWMFACPLDVAETIDLHKNDAPRTVSHSLGAKRERPAVAESTRPDNFGHEIWNRILAQLPVPGQLTHIRSNSYRSASLYILDDPQRTTSQDGHPTPLMYGSRSWRMWQIDS